MTRESPCPARGEWGMRQVCQQRISVHTRSTSLAAPCLLMWFRSGMYRALHCMKTLTICLGLHQCDAEVPKGSHYA